MSEHKKSLLTFVVVLVLLTGGSYIYLNWFSAQHETLDIQALQPAGVNNPDLIEQQLNESSDEDSDDEEQDDETFFVEYRLKRERTRSQRIDILNMVINNPNTAAEVRLDAQKELERIAQLTETEMIVENLLTAKGFEDALLFWHEGSVNVIIKTEGLSQTEAIQVRDIVARALQISMGDVVIIEK